jgi:hypothetical protein
MPSGFDFPIFISSPVHNLRDLRAELAHFLESAGYRPILSTGEGFPDRSPDTAPWESCLPVLKTCFIAIVILDGRYGDTFKWPSFPGEIGDRDVSPTHAEILMARAHNIRTLVFVRQDLLPLYQMYRNATKEVAGLKAFGPMLPKHVDLESIALVHEVKTTKPIPWIDEFTDVADLKRKVQHKLLNELAATFLFRQAHLETVVKRFAEAISQLPEEERTRVLNEIGVTRDLVATIEAKTKTIAGQQHEIERMTKEVSQAKEKAAKAKLRTTLTEKTTELSRLKQERTSLIASGSISDSPFDPVSADIFATPSGALLNSLYTTPVQVGGSLFAPPDPRATQFLPPDPAFSLFAPHKFMRVASQVFQPPKVGASSEASNEKRSESPAKEQHEAAPRPPPQAEPANQKPPKK